MMFFNLVMAISVGYAAAFGFGSRPMMNNPHHTKLNALKMQSDGLKIDMKGKIVFVGGVADSTGYGWAIAKACAEAGAKVLLGTWPPVLPMFQMNIERGEFVNDQKLSDGSDMEIAKVYCGHFLK